MADAPMAGGNRRIDRILAQGFLDELDQFDMDEIRERRDLCRSERDYLSFLRRLLQGRRDLLRDELDHRAEGGERGSVVERVTAAMSESSRGPSRGEAVVIALPDDEIALARRRVERLLSDAHISNLSALSEEELEQAIARVEEEERGISDARGNVLEAHDALQGELKRRYRTQLKRLRT
jgi:hypothetical protein